MQHIVNIAFDFDDDKVKNIAEKAVKNDIDKVIENILLDEIAPTKDDYLSRQHKRDWSMVYEKIDSIISDKLDEYKEEIIDTAASRLIRSIGRSKAWAEKKKELLTAEEGSK